MSKLKNGSTWLGLLEQIIYICPTLATVLYYYFDEIQSVASKSSQYTFALALTLLIFFIVYRRIAKTKIEELRKSTVQTETDLENGVGEASIVAENARKKREKLDLMDRLQILIVLVIFALAVYILEQATIGLTTLAMIACGSVAVGSGIHIGVLFLKQKEDVQTIAAKKAKLKE